MATLGHHFGKRLSFAKREEKQLPFCKMELFSIMVPQGSHCGTLFLSASKLNTTMVLKKPNLRSKICSLVYEGKILSFFGNPPPWSIAQILWFYIGKGI